MKTLKMMLLLAIATLSFIPLQAQKLIKKELQTENEAEDGFQYLWYKYTYVLGKDTLEAAYDLNGKRITPDGYREGKGNWGVHYYGGGMFGVYSKNKTPRGRRRLSAYNVIGECIISETNKDYIFMHYLGKGFFELTSTDILGQIVHGAYDFKGNCIISEEWGFYSISYLEEDELFHCNKEDTHGERIEYTFSKDGNYYAEGWYYDRKEFERNKLRVPNCHTNNNSAIAGSSTSNSSTISTTSNTESGLLYEGDYTEGAWINPNTGYSQPAPMPNHHIKIYEDHIIIDMVSLPYQGKSINGEKMYVNSWSNITYYVDGFYNIRSTFPYGYSQFSKGNVVYDINAPVHGGYDNSNSGYGTTPQKHEHGTREVTETCPVCHSTGNCQTCLGRGWRTLTDNSTQQCPTCKGNKVCWKCNGTGKITKTERY